MKLDVTDIRNLASFLEALNEATAATGVNVCAYGGIEVAIHDSYVRISWDETQGYYLEERLS